MVGSVFSNFGVYFQQYGVMDFLLPFVLVFTIVYATLQKTHILGDKKNFDVIVALVLGLLFVVPHLTGSYPLGYDPVQVMNESLPSISLVSVAAIMVLLLMGIFGTKFTKDFAPIVAIAALGFVVYIFGSSLNIWTGPSDTFSWWTPEITELMIVVLIFGVVIWFITKEKTEEGKGIFSKAFKKIGDMVEK